MYCSNCGRKCGSDKAFCGRCGTPLTTPDDDTTQPNSSPRQPAITPLPPSSNRRTLLPIIASVTVTVIILLLVFSLYLTAHPGGANTGPTNHQTPIVNTGTTPTTDTSQQPTPTATDTPTPTTNNTGDAGNCPSANDVAQDIGEPDASLVTKIQGWPCDFKLADSNQGKRVHCPGAFNASLLTAVVPSGNLVIYWCPKGAATNMNVFGATIYDADIDTQGGACDVLAKTPGATVSGTTC